MSSTPKAEAAQVNLDEEKLAHALISRGLIAAEEYRQVRLGTSDTAAAENAAEALLQRLVKAGFLTMHQARRAVPELAALMTQPIPGYELLDKLGQGAMGTVHKARQLSMDRLVAIKILQPRLSSSPEFIKRFEREARIAAKFSHNNIVQAIDVGSARNIHFFIMEYVEGKTLKQEIENGKIYEEKEALDIVLQTAQALAHAHKRKLIHRDIKPANIILTADGVAKLADLGMARATGDVALAQAEKGMTIGTPYYIAPEQVHGRTDVDSRADIYSLGATFYHMVTGQPPFPGKKVDAVLRAHLEEELTPPDHLNTSLSAGVGEVIEFMMAKDRRQRYQTPDDLIIDLECLFTGLPPKLARQRLEAATLKDLAEGEEDVDEADKPVTAIGVPQVWLAVLGAVLTLSLLANLFLLLK
jgi:serine/threonine protein kinase